MMFQFYRIEITIELEDEVVLVQLLFVLRYTDPEIVELVEALILDCLTKN